jgi:peptide/nickel transport system substrate-binding protein
MKFESYTPQESVRFVRNDAYAWAPDIWGHQGPAYLDAMTFLIIPEPAARVTALEAGDANGIEDTPAQDVLRLREDPAYTLIEARLPGAPRTFFLNTERAPLDDLKVRQALSHGLDVPQVVQLATFGLQPPATGPFSQPTLGYSAAAENFYPYDPVKAGALLDEAGWTMGSDGIRVKDGQPLRLTAIGFPVFEALYTAAQSVLRQIGVDVDVQILDSAAATAANQRGDGHLAMTGVVSSDPSGIALLYHSRNYDGFAFSRWKDPEFDKLWDDAAVETDPDARMALYEQIQLYIMENALSIPTQQLVRYNFVASNVQGVRQDARGLYPWFDDTTITG